MGDFEVRVHRPRQADRKIRMAADVLSPRYGNDEIWYEVDERAGDALVGRADPFVLSALALALREEHDVRVSGAPVSSSLLQNLQQFQEVWHTWYGLPVLDIEAEEDARGGARPDPAIVGFSGGLDSAFSAHMHTRGRARRKRNLRAGVMIRGIDIPRDEVEGWNGATARARRMLDSLGLDLLTVETNAWELPPTGSEFFALRLTSVLHLFGARFGTGLFPATSSYEELIVPIGSSPVSDWMLGSSSFEIVHDGAAYSRLDKLRVLADWDEALESLRVCLLHPRHDRNCGRCNKCMLTIAGFRVLGLEPRCFDMMPTDEMIVRWARSLPSARLYVREARQIVDEASSSGIDEPWVRALRSRLLVIRTKHGVRELSPSLANRAAALHRRVHQRRRAR